MSTQTYVNGVTLTDAGEFNAFDSVAYSYLTSVAGTNTITATGPANMTLAAPQRPVVLVPAVTNTGATTLNITPSGGAALTAKNVFSGGFALTGGELVAGVPVSLVYDGTQYNILGVASGSTSFTGTLTGVSGTVTGTVFATKVGNVVVMNIPLLTGTSDATTKTITGCPAGLFPARTQEFTMVTSDNGGSYVDAQATIATNGVITITASLNGAAWTGSGTATIRNRTISYTLA
jgi:hypothetical protein